MKRCCRCGGSKPLSEFFRSKRSPDGHKAHCKACDVAARDKWRRENAEHKKRTDRAWRAKNPASSRAAAKRHRERHPDRVATPDANKARARKALNHAVENGDLIKPDSCERCGAVVASRLLHGHHEDYAQPLEVEWLCSTCHGLQHRED